MALPGVATRRLPQQPALRLGRSANRGAELSCAMAAAVAVVAVVTSAHRTVWAAGAVCFAALGLAAFRSRRSTRPLLAGQLPYLSAAAALLVVADGGASPFTTDTSSLRPAVALAAYPFLGRATLRLVSSYRRIREADVVVEGALVAAATAIVAQVLVTTGDTAGPGSAWQDAEGALPALLVGLDAGLLVVAGRTLMTHRGRRSPLAMVNFAIACLFLAHLLGAARAHGDIAGVGWQELAAVSIGVAALGGLALHPRAASDPDLPIGEPPLFSRAHALLVVAALLAAPAVLAVQAVRQVTASATVATGAVLSGAILASYLVGLLQERAATEHNATHDQLTGLPNRTLFTDRVERSIAHARRSGGPVAVLFVDLDHFKHVNDSLGHGAGDLLLQEVSARLEACRREEDTVARLGGDEFALLLPHSRAAGDVVIVAQRILDALAKPVTLAGERLLIGGSVGVAVFPDDGATAEELLASADAAMYRAKETGGHTYELFNAELATGAHHRMRLEAALYDGIARDELVLHYQPIVDLATGRTVGAEALVRWAHPEDGLLLPGHFVPVAEQSELVVLLGERVILDACRELRRWRDLGLDDVSVSVNVSSRHFSHGLTETITAALRLTGADPRNLVVELTESTAVDNLSAVAATLQELRDLGVRSAIDDFGTGYCGLRYLGDLPVDALKIDKSFVQSMTPSAAAIVAATIAMGHSLGLTLVAEGVETVEQRRFLTDQGCDRIQGYLDGRPMPATDFVDRVRAERARPTSPPVLRAVPGLDRRLATGTGRPA